MDVDINSTLSIIFSESIDASSLNSNNIVLLKDSTPVPVGWSVSGTNLVVTPILPLNYLSNYTLSFFSTIKDVYGNALSNSYSIPFITINPDLSSSFQLSNITPLQSSTGIPIGQKIILFFSQDVDMTTINASNIQLLEGITPVIGNIIALDSKTIQFIPNTTLKNATVYSVLINSSIKSTSGAILGNTIKISFTTEILPQLSLGLRHTCYLNSVGKLRCWGSNQAGQISAGDEFEKSDAVALSPLETGFIPLSVSTHNIHTCTSSTDNQMKCFGSNSYGQLGVGNNEEIRDISQTISLPVKNVAQIAVGDNHTCALLKSGNIKCWGDGSSGQLGYGNNDSIKDASLAPEINFGIPVTQIAAGKDSTCVAFANQTAKCWGATIVGANFYTFFGTYFDDYQTNIINDALSSTTLSFSSNIIQISIGNSQKCFLLSSGNIACIGGTNYNELGYWYNYYSVYDHTWYYYYYSTLPEEIKLTSSIFFSKISCNGNACYAVSSTGDLYGWGELNWTNLNYTQLSNSIYSDAYNYIRYHIRLINVGAKVKLASKGQNHSCVLLINDHVKCWGTGVFGALGYSNKNDITNPISVGELLLP
jgi:alpha-tubulin suppressor-like RCC1 family protein